jgi:hypothetical protein
MPLLLWLASLCRQIPSSRARPQRQARRLLDRLRIESLEGRWLPSTFLVSTTDDAGPGSLRQAILDANATPGTNEIDFAIGDGGAQTIRPRSDLPWITHSVVLDGSTQPGFNGSPLIDLDGGNTYLDGLVVTASDCTIRGLAITDFQQPDDPCTFLDGLYIRGDRNVVEGNQLGTNVTASSHLGNSVGLFIVGSNNRVGGTTAEQRNLISGNITGMEIYSGGNNVVLGNYIGTDATGTASLGNVTGLKIDGSNNLIGGTTAQDRNLISGNQDREIELGTYYALSAHSNRIQGNYIGTDVTGTRALNTGYGVTIYNGSDNLIGGTEAGAGNLISGNRANGVDLQDQASGNVIQGNFIGTDPTGTIALRNGGAGVYIFAGSNNLIGGTEAGAGNLISGNGWNGIYIASFGADGGNRIEGNLIGTDFTGTQPVGNAHDGVHIYRFNNNTVGGEEPGAGNTIAFNGGDGVLVDRSTGNAILGNAIFANGNLGIELLNGGNHNPATPEMSSATTDGTSTTVSGTLSSTPDSTFTLEFFVSDSSGRQQFLGSVVVTTDSDGNASFTATFDTAVDPGSFVTATATDAAHNTSVFSAGVEVTA